MPRVTKPKRKRGRHFFRAWRKHRELSTERAAELIGMSRENLGRIERHEIPYDQDWLELAAAVYKCDPGDLVSRPPKSAEPIWVLWDRAKPTQRRQIVGMVEGLLRASEEAA